MNPNYTHQQLPVEGYFRRSKQSMFWIVAFSMALVIGGMIAVVSIMDEKWVATGGTIIAVMIIALLGLRRKRYQMVKVYLADDKLRIKGAGYHIQLQAPFRYQTGVQRIRATGPIPEYHYIRMVLDVYGKPLVFEEQVPSGVQPPKLDEILGISSALGIAELSSTKYYPSTLWSLIQQFDAMLSQNDPDQVERDIESLYRTGEYQLNTKSYYGAIQTFSEIIRLTPESPYPYYNRGTAHFYHGQNYDKAIRDLTTAIRLKPKFDKAFRMRGLVRAENGDWEGLRDDSTEAIRLNSTDAELYNIRGGACYRLKDYQAALADFDRAIQLSTENPEPYHNRGLVKQQQGDLDGAIGDFQYAMKLNPFFEPARKSLERAEYERDQQGP
jgi:regulator of sirC expression with transglutaminase-like and TPR domain